MTHEAADHSNMVQVHNELAVHLSSLIQDVFFMKKKSVQFPTPLCESTNRAEALKYSLKFFFDIMNRKQMEEHCWKT